MQNRAKNYEQWFAARVKHGCYIGGKESPEHYIWRTMLVRCRDNAKGYEDVEVCERWKKFENFITDMGKRPSPKHSLDRFPNTFGNYKPSNCRWATRSQQQTNKRNTIYITDGVRIGVISQWATWLNISRALATYRWNKRGTLLEGRSFRYRTANSEWQNMPIKPRIREVYFKAGNDANP